jgi:hypothetical protein
MVRLIKYEVVNRNFDWWKEWLDLTNEDDYGKIISYADLRSHQNAFEENHILNISGTVPFGTLFLRGDRWPEPLFSVKDLFTACMNTQASESNNYPMEDLINHSMHPVVVHNERDDRNYICYFPPFHCSEFRGLYEDLTEPYTSMFKCPQDAMVPGFNQLECDTGHTLRGAPNRCSLRMDHNDTERTFTLYWVPDETAALSGLLDNGDMEPQNNFMAAYLLSSGEAFLDKGTPDDSFI